MYGGIFAVNLELTGDNEPLLEENDRQRCQPIADRISSIISEYEKAGNDRNKLSTFNTLYRDLETSITALVDSNAFALSLPLFLLSD